MDESPLLELTWWGKVEIHQIVLDMTRWESLDILR